MQHLYQKCITIGDNDALFSVFSWTRHSVILEIISNLYGFIISLHTRTHDVFLVFTSWFFLANPNKSLSSPLRREDANVSYALLLLHHGDFSWYHVLSCHGAIRLTIAMPWFPTQQFMVHYWWPLPAFPRCWCSALYRYGETSLTYSNFKWWWGHGLETHSALLVVCEFPIT